MITEISACYGISYLLSYTIFILLPLLCRLFEELGVCRGHDGHRDHPGHYPVEQPERFDLDPFLIIHVTKQQDCDGNRTDYEVHQLEKSLSPIEGHLAIALQISFPQKMREQIKNKSEPPRTTEHLPSFH